MEERYVTSTKARLGSVPKYLYMTSADIFGAISKFMPPRNCQAKEVLDSD